MVDNVEVSITVTAILVFDPPSKMANKGESNWARIIWSAIANSVI
jgi:hypothetical protein